MISTDGIRKEGHHSSGHHNGYDYLVITSDLEIRWYVDFPISSHLARFVGQVLEVYIEPEWGQQFAGWLGINGDITFASLEGGVCKVGGICDIGVLEPDFDRAVEKAELSAQCLIDLVKQRGHDQ